MAVETYKELAQSQVPSSATTIYTAPASTSTIVKHMVVVNPTGSDATIKLWQSGSTDPFIILPVTTVVTGGWAEFEGIIIMDAGDTLQAQSGTNNALTLTVYGLELS